MTASASSQDLSALEKDPRLFLYTSLTAGSSHIITATSRMETILKANKIPFLAIDIATDEKARRLWQRRAGKRKLPGLVKEGFVLGDLDEVEEWNEFEELKENIGPCPPVGQATNLTRPPQPAVPIPVKPTATQGTTTISKTPSKPETTPASDENTPRALPGAGEIAARAQSESKPTTLDSPPAVESMTSAPKEKETSITTAAETLKTHDAREDHLSAPPSGVQTPAGVNHLSAPPSGTQTPAKAREAGFTSAAAQVSAINNLKAEEGIAPTATAREDHLSAPPSGVQTPAGVDHLSAPPSGAQTPAENTPSTSQATAITDSKTSDTEESQPSPQTPEALSIPPSGTQTPAKARETGLTSAAAQVSAVNNLKAEEGAHSSVQREDHLLAPPSGVQTPAETGSGSGEGAKGVTLPDRTVGSTGGSVEGEQTGAGAKVSAQTAAEGGQAGESVED
ncbi:hypothetical protein MBLNU230_g6224t1 [Neophaeotheca triangularis]